MRGRAPGAATDRIERLLAADGPLAALVPGFRARREQQEMAVAVAAAIASRATLVCEAGTGTGKTFAYLVPALAAGARTIVSTGTKTLQEQLYRRDLPLVRRALGVSARLALLKGRANYLCLHRLERAAGVLPLEGEAEDLARVRAWAARSVHGDIAEVADVAEGSPVWPAVTSTVDNCLGTECPRYSECFVVRARRDAAAADVVVVNHHLFLADMTLREEGFGELMPSADLVVFDEAHQLPDLAAEAFGISVSARQLTELGRDAVAAQRAEAADMDEIAAGAEALEPSVAALRAALGGADRRGDWRDIGSEPQVRAALERLVTALGALGGALGAGAERGPQTASVARRAALLHERLRAFAGDAEAQAVEPAVRWVEVHRRSFVLHRTPVDVAGAFGGRLRQYGCARVFTSATLAVGEDFSFFADRLGLGEVRTGRWESPYDFRRQALLYLPDLDREPADPGYVQAVCATALPVLEASGGRAFVLFTSLRALREAAAILAERLSFPLLVQGQAPRGELLERFRETAGAVLLGSMSFWEGVDVRGDALSCVIIDKLPFASPDDPLLRARLALMREQGRNPFLDYQVPEAVIALKQGVGRLIRDESDRGVLVLCDPRLRRRRYGRTFLEALPPMPVTRDVADVTRFFAAAASAL